MSEAPLIANDLTASTLPRRTRAWARGTATKKADGGPLYAWLASSALSLAAHRRRRGYDASLEMLSGRELHLIVTEAIRHVRRTNNSFTALDELTKAIGEMAGRVSIQHARDPEIQFAAARMIGGRNVELAHGVRRRTALCIAAVGSALLGRRVHVLSVDDALAKRLYELTSPLYQAFGIVAGYIDGNASRSERRLAYSKTVVHVGGLTLGADYLSDLEIAQNDGRRLKAAVAAIASPEIETARVIAVGASQLLVEDGDITLGNAASRIVNLAGEEEVFEATKFAEEAIDFARQFIAETDYGLDNGIIALTDRGLAKAARMADAYSPLWTGSERRQVVLERTLKVIHELVPGEHYTVDNGIIRPASPELQKAFEEETHSIKMMELIRVKENIIDSTARRTRRSSPMRAALRSYGRIGVISVPGAQISAEFWQVYGLPTIRLDRSPEAHGIKTVKLASTKDDKTDLILRHISRAHDKSDEVVYVLSAESETKQLAEALDNHDVDRGRLRILHLKDIVSGEGTVEQNSSCIIAMTGSMDEDFRRLLDHLGENGLLGSSTFILHQDDSLFSYLPSATRSGRLGNLLRRRAQLYLKAALSARRRRFSGYRQAQVNHLKAMDRVLAFGGDGDGG